MHTKCFGRSLRTWLNTQGRITVEVADKDLAQRLRKWYFETGGLHLSQETRQAYFSLLDGLEVVARRTDSKRGPEEDNQVSTRRLRGLRGRKNKVLDPPIPRQDDEFLRVLGSRLRTALTRDVGTRRTFMFRGDTDRASRVSQARTYSDDSGTRELRIATRWWQKLPIVGALLPGHPVLRLKGASSARWVPSRTAFLARISDSGDPRSRERRVFFIEPGQVVEGPEGWQRTGKQDRSKSVIWKVES